jgi:hypothetical protein
VEAVVVVLALAVGGLLVVKSTNRDERPPALDWLEPLPTHELALMRTADGAWVSTGRPPEDSTLTVTLVVPWEEVGERYRGLNVVVR